jgi:hypothetical protein
MTNSSDPAGWPAQSGGPPVPSEFAQPGPDPSGFGQPGPDPAGYATPGYGVPVGQPPPTYLVWARIAAVGGVLFNLILGLPAALIAMRYGRQSRGHWQSGNPAAAVSESRKARTWAIVSTVLDLLGVVFLVVIIAASNTPNFNNPAVVAASIKTQIQKRISDPSSPFYQAGLTVTSVVCTSLGNNTDRCVDHFSNGRTASEIAVISANGERYVTR